MASAVPTTPASSLRVTLWVLLIVYVFNFLDPQIVTILAEPISKELGLSDTQIGLMTGLAFALFYTVLGIPIARYADKSSSNRVRIISVALAIWSAMTMLCGFANNFVQLLLLHIIIDICHDLTRRHTVAHVERHARDGSRHFCIQKILIIRYYRALQLNKMVKY